MKKALLIVGFLLILVAIPLTVYLVRQRQELRQKAIAATTLYIEPVSNTKNVGDTFTVDIMMDTGTNQVSGARIYLTFNPQYLEAQTIVNGGFLPNILLDGEVGTGTASIQLGASGGQPKTGIGKVATVTFLAVSPADASNPAIIAFDETLTGVAALDDLGNPVLRSTQPASVIILAPGASPGPSASPTPGASASPGATPTPGASVSPTPTATPPIGGGTSPTPVPSASASPGATPTPAPSPSSSAQTTRITSPANNSTTTDQTPTISGVTAPNAFLVISINSNPQINSNTYANAQGDWSYTPVNAIPFGTYVITVTATDNTASGAPETATATVTIASSSTGGTAVATSSPISIAATPAVTTGKGGVPVTGNTTPTFILLGLALIMLVFGGVALLK